MRRFLALLALPLLLSACETLSEQQCLTANWYDIGIQDGANGRPVSYIASHTRACRDTGVVPETPAWMAGREVGLRSYCTPQNVYDRGRNGVSLSPVCPASQAWSLERAHEWGLMYHQIGTEIRAMEAEIRQIRAVIAAELSGPDLTPEQLDRLRNLQFQIRRLEGDIRLAETRQRRYASLPPGWAG